jgi:RNA polymerase sigma factor for flagellar operon FliA
MSALPSPAAFQDAQPLTYKPTTRRDGDALVRQHLALVRKLAWHVHGSMSSVVEVEDLVQVGLVALVEAAAQFEDRGLATFRQYLVTRLRGAMVDELRRQATATRGAMRRRRAYAQAVSILTQQLGRPPEDTMIAQHLGVTLDKMRVDYQAADTVRFEPIDDLYADDLPWFADDTPDAFAQLADSDERATLIAAIAALPEREAMVIQLYYVEELNLEEIGEVLGVGAARICQIKAAAHAKLKKAMTRRAG